MFGKLLGALVGFALGVSIGGWIGGVIALALGVFVGHRYDELHAEPPLRPDELPQFAFRDDPPEAPPVSAIQQPHALHRPVIEQRARSNFARHVTSLFAELARVDGEVTRDEVRVIREFFEHELFYSPAEIDQVRLWLKEALATAQNLDLALHECVREMPASDRILLLSTLYELALVDGSMRNAERDLLRRMASGLGLTTEEQRAIAAMHLGDGDEHYARLGVFKEASDEELRAAYKKLVAAHHPDKVAHLGLGPMELASKQFREINDAWEALRKLRGL